MRKNILYIIALLVTLSLTSCFDDDSTLGNNDVSDITVSGIETAYTKTAYVGEKLSISPTVETGYADSDMDYQWLLLSKKTGTTTASGDTIQPTVIGTEKNLNYEVSVAPGTYQVRFVAKSKTNDYTVYKAASLTVQTNFSQGFYILKETADGNTELDMLNNSGELGENLFQQTKVGALQGKPLSLDIDYNMYYINTDDDQMETANAITVTTDSKQICVSRSTDLKTIFDRNSLLFDVMDANEQPYGIINSVMGYLFYFSSKGIRAVSAASAYTSASSGKFGLPVSSCGGSKYITHDLPSYGGTVFWDETAHSLMVSDYNATVSPMTYSDLTGDDLTQNLTDYDCLHIGYNYMSSEGTATAILKNNTTGKRYLYQTESSFGGIYLSSRREISSSLHAATATAYSTNGQTAKYIYCVDGGKLYACIFNNDELSEVELQPQGIGSGETITYVSNQFWEPVLSGGDEFNYLIVGTQKGDQYKLYMYETVGGAPSGDPVKTVSGTGTVRSIRYLNPQFDSNDWQFGNHVFNIND